MNEIPAAGAARAMEQGPRPTHWTALGTGLLAALLLLAAPAWVAGLPLGLLLADAALAWGIYGLIVVQWFPALWSARRWLVPALAPWVALPMAAIELARALGLPLPPGLTHTPLAVALVLALALGLFPGLARAAHQAGRDPSMAAVPLGLSGAALLAAVVGAAILVGVGPADPAVAVAALAFVVAGAAVAGQWLAGRRLAHRRARALAAAPALAVAAGQLLDGVVSYLAVRDPLGLLTRTFTEEVWVSAKLLSAAGPLYPLTKWGLAIGAVLAVEAPGGHGPALRERERFGLYLLLLFLGLVPGTFSLMRLLL